MSRTASVSSATPSAQDAATTAEARQQARKQFQASPIVQPPTIPVDVKQGRIAKSRSR